MMWEKNKLLKDGQYKVVEFIGAGGFGNTYLAIQLLRDDAKDKFSEKGARAVVIKAPNLSFALEQDYEKFIRRFKREAQALSKIGDPCVVGGIDFFYENGMPCLVMSYVSGKTLNEVVKKQGTLSPELAILVFRQLATALNNIHKIGLIHCDIHPGNIILRVDGDPVLIDFGSVKTLQPSTLTVTTTVNESYSPYEQRRGSDPQPAMDVYALSATLYFVLTGKKPQTALSRKLGKDRLKPPQLLNSDVSDWLNSAILKGMALEPKDRPISMEQLESLLHDPGPSTPLVLSFLYSTYSSLSILFMGAGRILLDSLTFFTTSFGKGVRSLSKFNYSLGILALTYIPIFPVLGLLDLKFFDIVQVMLAGLIASLATWFFLPFMRLSALVFTIPLVCFILVVGQTSVPILLTSISFLIVACSTLVFQSKSLAVDANVSIFDFLILIVFVIGAISLSGIMIGSTSEMINAAIIPATGTATGMAILIAVVADKDFEKKVPYRIYGLVVGGVAGATLIDASIDLRITAVFGISFLICAQLFISFRSLTASYKVLTSRFSSVVTLLILSVISALGIALGGVSGHLLHTYAR